MNNHFENNFSDKKNKKYKKRSESKNQDNSRNYSDQKNITSKNNNYRIRSSKNKFNNNSELIDKKEQKSFPSSKRNNISKPHNKFSSINKSNYEVNTNKRNFDDWIWGKHSVYAALSGKRPINRIWCTSEIYSSEKFYILLKELKTNGVLIEEVSWNRLSQLTFGATHQGIAIQLASSESIPLNKLIDLSLNYSKNPVIVALDGITDPHNLGAIIRSAEAFNCKGIILPQRRSVGLTGTVAKVAAGALEHIPVSRVVNLNRALDELKKNGFFTIGLSANGRMPLKDYVKTAPLVLIVGAEDKGISLLTQKKCDFLLRIPLRGKTSSLNASVAAAISLFHLTNK